MSAKQLKGLLAPDGSQYKTFTDGANNLVTVVTSGGLGSKKFKNSLYAPDGSVYITVTDGNGNLT